MIHKQLHYAKQIMFEQKETVLSTLFLQKLRGCEWKWFKSLIVFFRTKTLHFNGLLKCYIPSPVYDLKILRYYAFSVRKHISLITMWSSHFWQQWTCSQRPQLITTKNNINKCHNLQEHCWISAFLFKGKAYIPLSFTKNTT